MKDLKAATYNGPKTIADEVANSFPENRDKINIIDIACGTGRNGDEAVHGFKNVDGLDPSDGMLKHCKDKGLYNYLYIEFCGETTLPTDDGVYDCLVASGGNGESHIPCSGILEMIRIVKPGGLIFIVMRKEFAEYVGEEIDKLETFVANLECENKVEMIERSDVAKYSFDRNGILFQLKKSCI